MASPRRNASRGAAAAAAGRDGAQSDSPTYTTATPRSRFAVEFSPEAFDEPGAGEAPSAKESVTATVRFRPLSSREIRQGEEIAWYADGETIVRSEHNPNIAYAYDRVFGPTTTTQQVYDVAAQHVVSGAMQGINGTIFAYGVTSSGKTHTMHGDQRSPGIIPLAVKDAFGIIQETLNREFLLRVSYLEIYNEVVNDLLNPAGKNLRIREDLQGTFVEGIKEEVVLSPTHVLSLIAAGEEHRHVGSTNFNLLSSRSHTIFTLTVESSPFCESNEGETVTFSQLNLIDLAGSESSRAETTGARRKEGSYINKSLLTLGTVISKLTDGKATHVPFRNSKLTRLLQSSLSGQGRVSLICTVTPASSNSEETHNTLKFAHRSKHIEIQALQNKIIDEKSLIKKYQSEIRQLREELEQLKRGIFTATPLKDVTEDNIILWKQKLEDGNVKLQSRLEQEEEAKAALLGRIQRLTKLILVSTRATQTTRSSQHPGTRRRHSFGEGELAYLPHRRRDIVMNNYRNELVMPMEGFGEALEMSPKEEKQSRKGLLNWFKLRVSRKSEILDDVDLLREQLKISSGEAVLHANVVKHLTEEAGISGMNKQIEMEKMANDEIKCKRQIISLENQNVHSVLDSQEKLDTSKLSSYYTKILKQLNEKAFQLEVKTADNRILEDQLEKKAIECEELRETVVYLKEQIVQALQIDEFLPERIRLQQQTGIGHDVGSQVHNDNPLSSDVSEKPLENTSQSEIGELKQRLCELTEAKAQLEARNQELLEESTYAKGLASAAGVELRALSEEVTKLVKQNEKLAGELESARNSTPRRASHSPKAARKGGHIERHEPGGKRDTNSSSQREQALEAMLAEKDQREAELQKKIEESKQKEAFLEGELANIWTLVAKLRKAEGNCEDDSDAIHTIV
ncbi:kinesin-like protein KIN-7D, chloroplastic isoform X2 [Triticum urartu]|uniref:kinesin-like protein KIN-7D, chloroplastic isoform X2 n=1 Tax=Triticum urartu TaxID=4572 RepID=UPI002043C613|nr:kinesin-like protein KIN-7D, chloroplastic isoform X2 [Triticum urartu]XP_048542219.1 kinesin-like protein KIN-7D, chloroplastic isoform X2 [Triticum urartu]